MKKCKIVQNGKKWKCVGSDGKCYCAYDRRDWAVECAKHYGFEVED